MVFFLLSHRDLYVSCSFAGFVRLFARLMIYRININASVTMPIFAHFILKTKLAEWIYAEFCLVFHEINRSKCNGEGKL